jgi:hypothetical protein
MIISDFTKFALIFLDNSFAKFSEDFPEITDNSLNKQI